MWHLPAALTRLLASPSIRGFAQPPQRAAGPLGSHHCRGNCLATRPQLPCSGPAAVCCSLSTSRQINVRKSSPAAALLPSLSVGLQPRRVHMGALTDLPLDVWARMNLPPSSLAHLHATCSAIRGSLHAADSLWHGRLGQEFAWDSDAGAGMWRSVYVQARRQAGQVGGLGLAGWLAVQSPPMMHVHDAHAHAHARAPSPPPLRTHRCSCAPRSPCTSTGTAQSTQTA